MIKLKNKIEIFSTYLYNLILAWRAPKSLVEPTWGFNYVKLRKVGT
jgi:hypothetical protein